MWGRLRGLGARGLAGKYGLKVWGWNVGVMTPEQAATWGEAWLSMANRGELDILLLSELGHTCPAFEGFSAFEGVRSPLRSDVGARRGQGLCMYVREGLAPFCSLVKSTQCWVWVKVRLPGRHPLFVCCVYLPPATSKLWGSSSADPTACGDMVETYHALQSDIALLQQQGEVCVLGDLNAHTGELDDRALDGAAVLDDLGAPGDQPAAVPARHNSDTSPVNQSGRLLIELCTATEWACPRRRDRRGDLPFLQLAPGPGWRGCVGLCCGVSVPLSKGAIIPCAG